MLPTLLSLLAACEGKVPSIPGYHRPFNVHAEFEDPNTDDTYYQHLLQSRRESHAQGAFIGHAALLLSFFESGQSGSVDEKAGRADTNGLLGQLAWNEAGDASSKSHLFKVYSKESHKVYSAVRTLWEKLLSGVPVEHLRQQNLAYIDNDVRWSSLPKGSSRLADTELTNRRSMRVSSVDSPAKPKAMEEEIRRFNTDDLIGLSRIQKPKARALSKNLVSPKWSASQHMEFSQKKGDQEKEQAQRENRAQFEGIRKLAEESVKSEWWVPAKSLSDYEICGLQWFQLKVYDGGSVETFHNVRNMFVEINTEERDKKLNTLLSASADLEKNARSLIANIEEVPAGPKLKELKVSLIESAKKSVDLCKAMQMEINRLVTEVRLSNRQIDRWTKHYDALQVTLVDSAALLQKAKQPVQGLKDTVEGSDEERRSSLAQLSEIFKVLSHKKHSIVSTVSKVIFEHDFALRGPPLLHQRMAILATKMAIRNVFVGRQEPQRQQKILALECSLARESLRGRQELMIETAWNYLEHIVMRNYYEMKDVNSFFAKLTRQIRELLLLYHPRIRLEARLQATPLSALPDPVLAERLMVLEKAKSRIILRLKTRKSESSAAGVKGAASLESLLRPNLEEFHGFLSQLTVQAVNEVEKIVEEREAKKSQPEGQGESAEPEGADEVPIPIRPGGMRQTIQALADTFKATIFGHTLSFRPAWSLQSSPGYPEDTTPQLVSLLMDRVAKKGDLLTSSRFQPEFDLEAGTFNLPPLADIKKELKALDEDAIRGAAAPRKEELQELLKMRADSLGWFVEKCSGQLSHIATMEVGRTTAFDRGLVYPQLVALVEGFEAATRKKDDMGVDTDFCSSNILDDPAAHLNLITEKIREKLIQCQNTVAHAKEGKGVFMQPAALEEPQFDEWFDEGEEGEEGEEQQEREEDDLGEPREEEEEVIEEVTLEYKAEREEAERQARLALRPIDVMKAEVQPRLSPGKVQRKQGTARRIEEKLKEMASLHIPLHAYQIMVEQQLKGLALVLRDNKLFHSNLSRELQLTFSLIKYRLTPGSTLPLAPPEKEKKHGKKNQGAIVPDQTATETHQKNPAEECPSASTVVFKKACFLFVQGTAEKKADSKGLSEGSLQDLMVMLQQYRFLGSSMEVDRLHVEGTANPIFYIKHPVKASEMVKLGTVADMLDKLRT